MYAVEPIPLRRRRADIGDSMSSFVPAVLGVMLGLILILVLFYAAVWNQNRSYIIRCYTGATGAKGSIGSTGANAGSIAYVGLTPGTLPQLFADTFVSLTPGSTQLFSAINGLGQLGDSAGMVCTHDGVFEGLNVVAHATAETGDVSLTVYTSGAEEFPTNFVPSSFKVSIPADGAYHQVTSTEPLTVTTGTRWAMVLTNPDAESTTLNALNVGFQYIAT